MQEMHAKAVNFRTKVWKMVELGLTLSRVINVSPVLNQSWRNVRAVLNDQSTVTASFQRVRPSRVFKSASAAGSVSMKKRSTLMLYPLLDESSARAHGDFALDWGRQRRLPKRGAMLPTNGLEGNIMTVKRQLRTPRDA